MKNSINHPSTGLNTPIVPKKMDEDEIVSNEFKCAPEAVMTAAACAVGAGSLATGITLFALGKSCVGCSLTFFGTVTSILTVCSIIKPTSSGGELYMTM